MMNSNLSGALKDVELTLTGPAREKMAQLVGQVEEDVTGVRVYASPGGCSGISFGMTFTDQISGDDHVLEFQGFSLVVDRDAIQYLGGVEIDYVDGSDGASSFVFNNLPSFGGGCGTCGSSQGGGCA